MTKSPNLISLSKWHHRALIGAAAMILPFAVNAGTMEKNPVVENLQRPFDWTGFYIGGNIGGSLGEFEFKGSGGDTEGHLFSDVDVARQLDDFLPPGEFEDFSIRFIDRADKDRPDREQFHGSIIGGGQIGYQHQFGHFVIGIEGDFDRTANRSTAAFRDDALSEFTNDVGVLGSTDFTGRREAIVNWQGSLRAKFGYATGPLLFYGTAGVTFAEAEVRAHDVANTFFNVEFPLDSIPVTTPGGVTSPQGDNDQLAQYHVVDTESAKDDDVLFGWTAGFGLEVALNDAVSLALEYRHNDYGDENFHFGSHHSNDRISPGGTNMDFGSDQVTVKMNVLLNHFFGNGGGMASTTPAANNVAIKSPFGAANEGAQVGYTKAKDASKWSAKDKDVAPMVEEFNWTGFYIGGNVGGVWTNYDFSHYDADVDAARLFFENSRILLAAAGPEAPEAPTGVPSTFVSYEVPSIDRGSDDSMIGGGQFGYQHQWNHWVFGVEGDFSGLSSEKSAQFASSTFGLINKGVGSETTLYSERKATVDWMASARAKIGYARGPVMLYVTGGAAFANVRTWASDVAVGDFFIPFINKGDSENFSARSENNTNDEDTVCGWTAGGGGEWAFSKIASMAVEYRHTGFDGADSHYDPHHSVIFASGNNVDIDSDQVTVRVNLLLGHMGPGH